MFDGWKGEAEVEIWKLAIGKKSCSIFIFRVKSNLPFPLPVPASRISCRVTANVSDGPSRALTEDGLVRPFCDALLILLEEQLTHPT